jgi:hypothetical protein
MMRAGMLGLLLLAGFSIAVWTRWFLPVSPQPGSFAPANLADRLLNAVGSGPAFYLLFTFRLVVRPIFASGLHQFALSLIPVFAILTSIYGLIQHSSVDLGGAVSGRAGVDRRRLFGVDGAKSRQMPGRLRRIPFCLTPKGNPFVAIYWKNLILAGRFNARQIFPMIAGTATACVLIISISYEQAAMVIGSIVAALACFLASLGPILFREDLRTDLKNIDMLKTYPIRGWGILLGEALAPAAILALLEWTLVLVAVCVSVDIAEIQWRLPDRIYVGLGAAILLPSITFFGVLIQNTTVLILPGWVHLGKEHPQGVEAMGQRLISSVATVLFLAIAIFPTTLVFWAVFFAGQGSLNMAIVPFASLLTALVLLTEAAVGIFWLGRLFDRFDASYE